MGKAPSLTGYITPVSGYPLPVQPPQAVEAIRFFMGPIPVVLLILSILFAWGCPISREQHRALSDELAARDTLETPQSEI
jgi:GPH family glycoside/pentoside/hexuronide:cation symporter